MQVIIVEDEQKSMDNLTTILQTYCEDIEILGIAKNALEAIKLINSTAPDIVFLDIEMPFGNGFDVLDAAENLDFHIIFTTAYNHYAIKALKCGAIDYLMKPISITELVEAINKAKHINQKESDKANNNLLSNIKSKKAINRISILQNNEYIFVYIEEIIYLKCDGSYTDIITAKYKYTTTKKIKYYTDLLSDSNFYKTSSSYLVNLNLVEKFIKEGRGILQMKNGHKVPISRPKIVELKKLLLL